MDNEDEELLRDKLQPDYKLYDHFYRKFDQLVQHYGKEKMKNEVDRLKYITNDLKNECQFVLVENNNRNVSLFLMMKKRKKFILYLCIVQYSNNDFLRIKLNL